MKALVASIFISGLAASLTVFAAAPAGAPAGTMGLCNDGSYSSSAEKKGACRGHKGVKEWYAEATEPAKGGAMAAPAATPPAPSTKTAAPPAATPMKTAAPAPTMKPSNTPAAEAAPGGGAGKVWANTSSKVYHCSGDKWYGKTKEGEYMSEADAKAKGYHAERGKACG